MWWKISASSTTDFPITCAAYDSSHNGARDVFVVRLDTSQSRQLTYGSFVGGSQNDEGYAIAIDDAVHAYVVGDTESTIDWPITVGVFSPTYNGGPRDAFATKLLTDPALLCITLSANPTAAKHDESISYTYENVG